MFAYPTIMLLCLWLISLLFWHKRFSRYLLILSIIFFYLIANGALGKWIISPLEKNINQISNECIVHNRALILLGDGITKHENHSYPQIISYSRLLEAYRIYQTAKKQNIEYHFFISGGHTNKNSPYSEAQLYKKNLVELGVPEKDIYTENRSLNTYDNAKFLKPILKNFPFKKYLLVTSSIHMKRAKIYFKHFGISTISAPSDFPNSLISIIPSAYNMALYEMALHEYIGIVRFKLYQFFNLN